MTQDRSTPTPPNAPDGDAAFSMKIPLIVALGFLMEALDQNIISASIPTISQDFGVSPERLSISVTAYILSVALFIPLSGWMADRFGSRRIFMSAMGLFVFASVLCGLSTNLEMLIAGRVLQGLGGALMLPVGRLIILQSFSAQDLVRAITWMTMPVLIGPLIGPVLGGFLTTYADWRWIFFVNVPVGMLGGYLAYRYIPDSAPAERRPFDFKGYILLALGVVAVQISIEIMMHPAVHAIWAAATFALGAGLIGLFVRAALGKTNVVIALDLLKIRTFRAGIFAGGLSRIGLNAVPFLLQLKLQLQMGYTPFAAGAVVLAIAAGAISLKLMTARLLAWLGFRTLLAVNAAIGAVLIASFATIGTQTPLAVLLALVFAFGVVRSLQFNAINSLTYAEIPKPRQSSSVAFGGIAQQLSMGLGVSLSAVALAQGDTTSPDTFHWAFAAMAAVPLVSAICFAIALHKTDGAMTSGHRSKL